MATTTMGQDSHRSAQNKWVYWAVAAIAVLAAILVFSMADRPDNRNQVTPGTQGVMNNGATGTETVAPITQDAGTTTTNP